MIAFYDALLQFDATFELCRLDKDEVLRILEASQSSLDYAYDTYSNYDMCHHILSWRDANITERLCRHMRWDLLQQVLLENPSFFHVFDHIDVEPRGLLKLLKNITEEQRKTLGYSGFMETAHEVKVFINSPHDIQEYSLI